MGRADDGMWDCHFVVKTGGGVTASRSRTESVKASGAIPRATSFFLPYSVSYLPQNFRNDFFSNNCGSIKLISLSRNILRFFFSARSSLQADCIFFKIMLCNNCICLYDSEIGLWQNLIRGINNQIIVSRINVIQSVSNLRNFAFSG